jgi:hypothetical protein
MQTCKQIILGYYFYMRELKESNLFLVLFISQLIKFLGLLGCRLAKQKVQWIMNQAENPIMAYIEVRHSSSIYVEGLVNPRET